MEFHQQIQYMRHSVAPVFACLSVCHTVSASVEIAGIVSPMWQQLKANTVNVGDLSSAIPNSKQVDVRSAIDNVKNTTECEIRLLSYEYALSLQPKRVASKLVDVFDALELETMCSVTRPIPQKLPPPSYPLPDSNFTYFVDLDKGNDTAAGTKLEPFATVGRALAATRTRASASTSGAVPAIKAAIVLRAGTHYLTKGLNLSASDSGLTITNYPGEESWLSGGVALKTKWEPVNLTDTHWDPNIWGAQGSEHHKYVDSGETIDMEMCRQVGMDRNTCTEILRGRSSTSFSSRKAIQPTPNVYVTKLDVPDDFDMNGLMTLQKHQRLTRARYPNADPEDRFTGSELVCSVLILLLMLDLQMKNERGTS